MDSDSSLDSAGPQGTKSPGSPQDGSSSRGSESPQGSTPPQSPPPLQDNPKTPESPDVEQVDQNSDSGPESPPPVKSPQEQGSSRSSSPSSRASSPADRSGGSGDEGSYHSPDETRRSRDEEDHSDDEKQEKPSFKPHDKEDLSDVSDMESQDGLGFDEEKPVAPVPKPVQTSQDALETELDFEAEEKEGGEIEDKEDGECGDQPGESGERSDGEVKDGDDLEEGECTDGDDARPEENEPRPICRFYNRGQCTWGSNCRFVHPGVTDKGNYTMFDMVRPLVPANGPPGYHDYRYDKTAAMQSGYGFPPKEDVVAPPLETAWERGLRHAKEMMRKATKRKESDMDFEEKKMNLSLGQEDLDKENDFYTRPASPVVARMEEPDYRYGRYEEEDEYYRPPPDQWRRVHYPPSGDARGLRVETGYERAPPREKYRTLPPDFHHPHEKRHSRGADVPHEGGRWKERPDDRPERYMESSSHRSRGDEWSDPWMRSKSPPRKGAPRRPSYSSGSSYTSSSRSSSRSSYSTYSSRSRSRSFTPDGPRSPGAPPVPQRKRPNAQDAPKQRKVARGRVTPPNVPDRKPPPAAGPVRRKEPSSPPPIIQKRPTTPPIPPPDVKPKTRSPAPEKKPSKGKRGKSSSGSDSDSGSSSDSSSTHSSSSSSSSRNASPPPSHQQPKPAKRIVIDGREALASMVKIKALDALKVSGQKQQIKLTLKDSSAPSGAIKKSLLDLGVASLTSSNRKEQQILPSLSRKRPAEPTLKRSSSPEGPGGSKTGASKKQPSRREELLKQLKAVEDAIRRKRFKS